MSERSFIGVIPAEHAYAELFEITAETHELHPETGSLRLKQDQDMGFLYNEVVIGTFPIAYGCSDQEVKELVARVDEDVTSMLQWLIALKPQNFNSTD